MQYVPRVFLAALVAVCAAAPAAALARPQEPDARAARDSDGPADETATGKPAPDGDSGNQAGPEDLTEAEEKEREDFLARVGASLEGEARARFDAMEEDGFDELLARSQRGDDLSAEETQILEALGTVVRQDMENELDFQTGEVAIGANLATLQLGEEMRYLGPADARTVLIDIWGNPPDITEPIGMLFAPGVSPLDDDGWGIIITYNNDGHVDDDDAEDIDFGEVLEQMQNDTRMANAQRKAQGYGTVNLIGWAEPPHYNRATHDLYWAKELDFSDAPDRTLNYAIRVLGREGVLELNAVANMDQLAMIKPEMEKVLTMVTFNEGHRYEDFDSSTDKIAAYGIGGLVAGKVLAKAGFFAVALKFLVAAKKFVIVGVLALCAGIGALFRRRREVEQSSPADE